MLTQKRLKELVRYEEGNLFWIFSPNPRAKVGGITGWRHKRGYIFTQIDGRSYANHRLIWLYHFGYFPEHGLDHIDRRTDNNLLSNLREISQSCNLRNSKTRKDNKSGVRGVYFDQKNKRWVASIKVNSKTVGLGWSQDFVEAVSLRLAAEQAEGWHGCDSSSPAFVYMARHLRGVGS